MRRFFGLGMALVLCVGFAFPVQASSKPFVPSISYKDGPQIVDADVNGDCLIVTTIPQARDNSTDICQEDQDLLQEIYEKLLKGSMKLPIEDDYVIRDLVDVSWKNTACAEKDHGHKEWLNKEEAAIKVTFDLGVEKNIEVIVLVYLDGAWVPAEEVKNNGDGTVTVKFEDIGPVAFCVKRSDTDAFSETGDEVGQNRMIPIVLMIASAAGLVALLLMRNRNRKK